MDTKEDSRDRLFLTLSPAVARILEDVSEVLGMPKTAIVADALQQALPQLLERADAFKKRSRELQQAATQAALKSKK